jgi:hypothetical protein
MPFSPPFLFHYLPSHIFLYFFLIWFNLFFLTYVSLPFFFPSLSHSNLSSSFHFISTVGASHTEETKGNWTGRILRRNCLLKHVAEEKIEGMIKGTGRRRRRCKQLLDDLKIKRRSWKWKEEGLDRTVCRTRFGRGYGPVVRQTAWWSIFRISQWWEIFSEQHDNSSLVHTNMGRCRKASSSSEIFKSVTIIYGQTKMSLRATDWEMLHYVTLHCNCQPMNLRVIHVFIDWIYKVQFRISHCDPVNVPCYC